MVEWEAVEAVLDLCYANRVLYIDKPSDASCLLSRLICMIGQRVAIGLTKPKYVCIIEVCLLKYYFESHLNINDAIIDKQSSINKILWYLK